MQHSCRHRIIIIIIIIIVRKVHYEQTKNNMPHKIINND